MKCIWIRATYPSSSSLSDEVTIWSWDDLTNGGLDSPLSNIQFVLQSGIHIVNKPLTFTDASSIEWTSEYPDVPSILLFGHVITDKVEPAGELESVNIPRYQVSLPTSMHYTAPVKARNSIVFAMARIGNQILRVSSMQDWTTQWSQVQQKIFLSCVTPTMVEELCKCIVPLYIESIDSDHHEVSPISILNQKCVAEVRSSRIAALRIVNSLSTLTDQSYVCTDQMLYLTQPADTISLFNGTHGFKFNNCSNISWSNITFQGGFVPVLALNNCSEITMDSCRVEYHASRAIELTQCENVELHHCIFECNQQTALSIRHTRHITLNNTLFIHCGTVGISPVINLENNTHTQLEHNEFQHCQSQSIINLLHNTMVTFCHNLLTDIKANQVIWNRGTAQLTARNVNVEYNLFQRCSPLFDGSKAAATPPAGLQLSGTGGTLANMQGVMSPQGIIIHMGLYAYQWTIRRNVFHKIDRAILVTFGSDIDISHNTFLTGSQFLYAAPNLQEQQHWPQIQMRIQALNDEAPNEPQLTSDTIFALDKTHIHLNVLFQHAGTILIYIQSLPKYRLASVKEDNNMRLEHRGLANILMDPRHEYSYRYTFRTDFYEATKGIPVDKDLLKHVGCESIKPHQRMYVQRETIDDPAVNSIVIPITVLRSIPRAWQSTAFGRVVWNQDKINNDFRAQDELKLTTQFRHGGYWELHIRHQCLGSKVLEDSSASIWFKVDDHPWIPVYSMEKDRQWSNYVYVRAPHGLIHYNLALQEGPHTVRLIGREGRIEIESIEWRETTADAIQSNSAQLQQQVMLDQLDQLERHVDQVDECMKNIRKWIRSTRPAAAGKN